MINFKNLFTNNWHFRSPGTKEAICLEQTEMGISFPEEFVEYLLYSNGGEGYVGKCYVSIWEIDQIRRLNQDYEIGKRIPGLVGFASDGGGECYAFDYRRGQPAVVRVPFGDLDSASVVFLGLNFVEAIERMKTGQVRPY